MMAGVYKNMKNDDTGILIPRRGHWQKSCGSTLLTLQIPPIWHLEGILKHLMSAL